MNPRLFIAFEIVPSEIMLREFANIRQIFSRDRFSWAKSGQLHMTLKFLGETPTCRIEAVKEAMKESFEKEVSVKFRLESLGVFGSSYAPKVLWAHVSPEDICRVWFTKLKSSLIKRGFEYDRQNFVPHLTLARIKQIGDKNLLAETVGKYQGFCFNESDVKEIVLYESVLKPTGAEYIKHFSVSLH